MPLLQQRIAINNSRNSSQTRPPAVPVEQLPFATAIVTFVTIAGRVTAVVEQRKSTDASDLGNTLEHCKMVRGVFIPVNWRGRILKSRLPAADCNPYTWSKNQAEGITRLRYSFRRQ